MMKKSLVIAVGAMLLSNSAAALQSTYFVDGSVSASGAGSSWATAFKTVQEGLNAATVPGDFVLVAEGTYTPTRVVNSQYPRSRSFFLDSGEQLSGGFTGDPNETTPFEPDGDTSATILSGDYPGTPTDDTDNAYSVVTVTGSSDVTIDGFKIQGGFADQPEVPVTLPDGFDKGGGIRVQDAATLSLSRVTVLDSTATLGGGIYVDNATLEMKRSRVRDNIAADGSGAGLYITDSVDSRIFNTKFKNNECTGSGSVDAYGGAIFCGADVDGLIVSNSILHDNDADKGGGVYVADHGDENYTSNWINNTIAFNNAVDTDGGGGVYVADMTTGGGAMLIGNSILYGNTARFAVNNLEDDSGSPSSLTVEYSDVYVDEMSPWTGSNNIDADPEFKNESARNLRLKSGSPCADSGDDDLVPDDYLNIDNDTSVTERLPLDYGGTDPINDQREMDDWGASDVGNESGIDTDTVDMGAYEQLYFQPLP